MKKGYVALVGGGPGDVGLLTLRAKELLETAEVIVYDRLVSADIMELCNESAAYINVGKASNKHLVPQEQINQILLEQALKGLLVVRLKGGDPYVFGRGGEELELLVSNGIDFEVVPGITSGIAAASYAGIPLTHRDFCSSFHVVTGHQKRNEPLAIDFDALVRTTGTLVFLMGVSSLSALVDGLLQAGMQSDMPAALVQSGTRPNQRKVVATLDTLVEAATREAIASPAIIVVGKVCSLSDQFDWFSSRALWGKNIVVTRPVGSQSTLEKKLSRLGAQTHTLPCVDLERCDFKESLDKALAQKAAHQWLVFTSKNGVDIFFDYLRDKGCDTRSLAGFNIAAVGKPTAHTLERYGIKADLVPPTYNSERLLEQLKQTCPQGSSIVLARAKNGTPDLPVHLRSAGFVVVDIGLYQSVAYLERAQEIKQAIKTEGSMVTFTSASTVEGFVQCVSEEERASILGVCIGEKTAQAARLYGITHVVAREATIDSMVEKIKEVARSC